MVLALAVEVKALNGVAAMAGCGRELEREDVDWLI
jgi:hypothetical protein